MATVAQLVRMALLHLRVIDANEAVEAQAMADGIFVLNAMMRRIEADGTAMGWMDVKAPTDVLPLPDEAIEPLGYVLATRLHSAYGGQIDASVVALASEGMLALRRDRIVSTPIMRRGFGRFYNVYTDSYQ